jgi:hypothetical protein
MPSNLLTEAEKRAIAARDIPTVSPQQADATARAYAEAARESTAFENVPPPVPLNTPPVKYEVHQLSSLSPEQQAYFSGAFGDIAAGQLPAAAPPVIPPQPAAFKPPEPVAPTAWSQVASQPSPRFEVVNDLPAEPFAPVATGAADQGPARCPHCEWPLEAPDPTEPEKADIAAFLQAQLGMIPYVHETSLYDGLMVVTFRTLTIGEIDAVYSQASAESKKGMYATSNDFFERVNRLRLCLQLRAVRSARGNADLPDGLSAQTNPHAAVHWKGDEPPAGETILPQIEAYVTGHVLTNESAFRVAHQACMRFNRLVAKMEALADSPGFWNPTGHAS